MRAGATRPNCEGLEGGDRFHILGSPTLKLRRGGAGEGLDAARAEANARKRARKQKKARRRFGTDCALGAGCDRPCCAPRTTLTHHDFLKSQPAEEESPPAYLMVLYLVGPVALGVGAARVARWVFEVVRLGKFDAFFVAKTRPGCGEQTAIFRFTL